MRDNVDDIRAITPAFVGIECVICSDDHNSEESYRFFMGHSRPTRKTRG